MSDTLRAGGPAEISAARRRILEFAMMLLSAAITAVTAVPVVGYLLSPLLRRIAAATPEGKRQILEKEIPARMEAMHVLTSTYPDLVMAEAAADVVLRSHSVGNRR